MSRTLDRAVLPCDVKIGSGVVFRKGVKLKTFVRAAERWYADAQRLWEIEHPTDEQRAQQIQRRLQERCMPGNSRLRIMQDAEDLNFLFKHHKKKRTA